MSGVLTTSKDANPNYLAKVVSLGDPVKHPNADRLQGFSIDSNIIWTDMSYNKGDKVVYFPLESQLSSELLKEMNMYASASMNADVQIKGYFDKHGRVRAVRLRTQPSMGIVLKTSDVLRVFPIPMVIDIADSYINTEFDTWNGELLLKKYVPKGRDYSMASNTSEDKSRIPRISRLVDNQFKLHVNTAKLDKNIHNILPDDIISITNKLHGTSFIVGKVLVKRELSFFERILNKLGINIVTEYYDTIYSSRNVIKNEYLDKVNRHYYNTDVWADVKECLKDRLAPGMTIYGEAVGWTSTGKAIQNGYDYGYQSPGITYIEGINYGIFVYRITTTDTSGRTFEFSWDQVKQYCVLHGMRHVPELYYGKAKDWANLIPVAYDWHDQILQHLKETYLEKDCDMCSIPGTPAEGIVIRADNLISCTPYKLKSFRFLEKETEALDKGEIDIESEQSVEEPVEA